LIERNLPGAYQALEILRVLYRLSQKLAQQNIFGKQTTGGSWANGCFAPPQQTAVEKAASE